MGGILVKKLQDFFILAVMGFLLVFAIGISNDDNQTGSDTNSESDQGNEDSQSDSNTNSESDQGNGDSQSDSNTNSESDQSNGDSPTIYWGVDSASYTDEDLLQCVQDNFGQADVWGRYLGDKEGVSQGLDTDEVSRLHENDVQILVIYNHFTDATGYDNGVNEAEKAIAYAGDLDTPDGVAIFGDIEPSYSVDSAFLEGWYDTFSSSDYEAALYGVFNEGSHLSEAYNATDQTVQENTIVWTAFPQEGITTKENAPDYNPQGPDDALLYGWQYGIEAEQCHIDTNLFHEAMLDYLW